MRARAEPLTGQLQISDHFGVWPRGCKLGFDQQIIVAQVGLRSRKARGRRSNHPPAKPGAFASEPLKAAIGALRDPMI